MIFSRKRFPPCVHDSNSAVIGQEFIGVFLYKRYYVRQEKINENRKYLGIYLSKYLTYYSYNRQTKENIFKMVSDPKYFRYIPYYQKNNIVIRESIEEASHNFGYIPDDLITFVHFKYMQLGGFDIRYIPDRFKTHSIINRAIHFDAERFDCVPDHMLEDKFIIELINVNSSVIRYIPDHLKTPKVAEAIKRVTFLKHNLL